MLHAHRELPLLIVHSGIHQPETDHQRVCDWVVGLVDMMIGAPGVDAEQGKGDAFDRE